MHFLVCLLFSHAYSSTPKVKVLMEASSRPFMLQADGLEIKHALTNEVFLKETSKIVLNFKCDWGDTLKVDVRSSERKSGTYAVKGPLKLTANFPSRIRFESRVFRGNVYVYAQNKKCLLINEVDLESYVSGLLNSEMNSKWPIQALMAQAVAARTYAIRQMRNHVGSKGFFDLHGSVKDQVYEGAHRESPQTTLAAQRTRGEILTFESEPIHAFYHSTCGGRTENAQNVWGIKAPYLASVHCGACDQSPRTAWEYRVSKEVVEKKLKPWLSAGEGGSLLSLRAKRGYSNSRVEQVELQTTKGIFRLTGKQFREALGVFHLRSTDFDIQVEAGSNWLLFSGRGSGHGVGLCQWGAYGLARQGKAYPEILKKYYPYAIINKIY